MNDLNSTLIEGKTDGKTQTIDGTTTFWVSSQYSNGRKKETSIFKIETTGNLRKQSKKQMTVAK